eukprot:m.862308 g.862308  ORF g.862308 m.862308 type:complete len:303 (+) comp59692_c0_seq2:5079-5987(+)
MPRKRQQRALVVPSTAGSSNSNTSIYPRLALSTTRRPVVFDWRADRPGGLAASRAPLGLPLRYGQLQVLASGLDLLRGRRTRDQLIESLAHAVDGARLRAFLHCRKCVQAANSGSQLNRFERLCSAGARRRHCEHESRLGTTGERLFRQPSQTAISVWYKLDSVRKCIDHLAQTNLRASYGSCFPERWIAGLTCAQIEESQGAGGLTFLPLFKVHLLQIDHEDTSRPPGCLAHHRSLDGAELHSFREELLDVSHRGNGPSNQVSHVDTVLRMLTKMRTGLCSCSGEQVSKPLTVDVKITNCH